MFEHMSRVYEIVFIVTLPRGVLAHEVDERAGVDFEDMWVSSWLDVSLHCARLLSVVARLDTRDVAQEDFLRNKNVNQCLKNLLRFQNDHVHVGDSPAAYMYMYTNKIGYRIWTCSYTGTFLLWSIVLKLHFDTKLLTSCRVSNNDACAKIEQTKNRHEKSYLRATSVLFLW